MSKLCFVCFALLPVSSLSPSFLSLLFVIFSFDLTFWLFGFCKSSLFLFGFSFHFLSNHHSTFDFLVCILFERLLNELTFEFVQSSLLITKLIFNFHFILCTSQSSVLQPTNQPSNHLLIVCICFFLMIIWLVLYWLNDLVE